MERYRSGHNELDSKSCRSGGRLTAETVGITGFLGISTLFYSFTSTDFLRFLRKVRSLWWAGKALQLNRQRYRRGHNEPDSKSCRSGVWLTAETVGITGFLGISTLFYSFTSTDFLHFFYALCARSAHCGGRARRCN